MTALHYSSIPDDGLIEAHAEAWVKADRPYAKPMSIPWEHLNPGLKRQYRARSFAALVAAARYQSERQT